MDYEQAVNYLSGLLRFGIKFGLDRFSEMCRRMGDPQHCFRSIHITGTNGKGSTTTFISSILQAAGYRVGTYLSPYVRDLRERIQINGEMIPREAFAALMTEISPVIESVGRTDLGEGTEFEAKTLMAFMHFAREQVDFAAVEVGMGGTYDATNVVRPLVSVITNVSLDHTDRLGTTVPQIAQDKAGIAKPGAPLVTGATGEAWETVHGVCRERRVEIWRVAAGQGGLPGADVEIGWEKEGDALTISPLAKGGNAISYPLMEGGQRGVRRISDLRIGLKGGFQYENAAVATAAIFALERHGIYIPDDAIRKGLALARLPGRLEVIRERPTVVLDAAHNQDGAEKLARAIPESFAYRRLILVIGMLSTHSAEGVLAALVPTADQTIATAPQWDKATPACEIADIAGRYSSNVTVIEPVSAAVDRAIVLAGPDGLVLVAGSFYTIGEVPVGD